MTPDGHKHGREGELVDAVLPGREPTGGGVHAGSEDGALVVGDHGPVPLRPGPVAGEGRGVAW